MYYFFFYPANFTPVSPTELINLSDRISEFRKLSTQILAVSIDSPFSHLQSLLLSRKEGGLANLNYPLISDLSQTITKDYKVLTEEGLGLPGVFIIDKEGIIQYYTVNNLLCSRSVNELLRILESIQYVKKIQDKLVLKTGTLLPLLGVNNMIKFFIHIL